MKFFFICTISILFFSSFPVAAEDIPYIYYYADQLHAFVIERADGTDSRIFAEGLIPLNHQAIVGPGWSPSGHWFAFVSNKKFQEGFWDPQTYVVSTDGTTVYSLPHAGDRSFFWLPERDILYYRLDRGRNVRLFDPTTNKTLFDHIFEGSVDSGWDTSDDTLILTEHREDRSVVYELNIHTFELIEQVAFPNTLYAYSTASYIAYKIGNQLQIYDPISQYTWKFDVSLISSDYWRELNWNPQRDKAVLFVRGYDAAAATTGLFFLSLNNETIQPVMTLPGHIDCQHNCISWSPDGTQVIIGAENPELPMMIFDTEAQQFDMVLARTCHFWVDEQHCLVSFFDEENEQHDLQLLDVETVTMQPFLQASNTFNISLSPGGRYFHDNGRIYDFETHRTVITNENNRYYQDWRVLWNDTDTWAILSDFHDSQYHYRNYVITSLDGITQRELTTCEGGGCVGWLPERVTPWLSEGQDEPVISTPSQSFSFDEPVVDAQWSEDGNYLEVVTTDDPDVVQPVTVTLWNVASGEQIAQQGCFRESCLGILTKGADVSTIHETLPNILPETMVSKIHAGRILYVVNQLNGHVLMKWTYDPAFASPGPLWVNNTLFLRPCFHYWHPSRGSLYAPEALAYFCNFSPDYSYGLFYFVNPPLRPVLYDTTTGEQVGVNFYTRFARFSPDGSQFFMSGYREITVWQVDDLLPLPKP